MSVLPIDSYCIDIINFEQFKRIFCSDLVDYVTDVIFKDPQFFQYISDLEKVYFYSVLNHSVKSGNWNVPVGSKFRRNRFRKIDFESKLFSPAGLFLVNDHGGAGWIKKKVFHYVIQPKFRKKIVEIIYNDEIDSLINGKKGQSFKKSRLCTDQNNKIPEKIRDAMMTFDRCCINHKELLSIATECKKRSNLKVLSFIRYINQQDYIPNQGYRLAYKVCSTGRMFERGAGFQNLPKRLKQRLLLTQPNVKNYDLRSSQVSILVDECIKNEIPCKRLLEFITYNDSKEKIAEKIGISVSDFKKIFFVKIFSGVNGKIGFSPENESFFNQVCEIVDEKLPYDQTDSETFWDECYKLTDKINENLKLYYAEISAWNNFLKDTYGHRKKVKNAAGIWLCDLDEYKNKRKSGNLSIGRQWVSKVSAFLLQGVEANFIYTVIGLSEKYNFTPISFEHDGLTVIGTIPKQCIDEAKQLTDFKYAEFDEKNFC